MLKFSASSLKFTQKQQQKYFKVFNQLNFSIIYLIQTNNKQAIEVNPNCGFIKFNSALTITVTRKFSSQSIKNRIINQSLRKMMSSDRLLQFKSNQDNDCSSETKQFNDKGIKLKIIWSQLPNNRQLRSFEQQWNDLKDSQKQSKVMKVKIINETKQQTKQQTKQTKQQTKQLTNNREQIKQPMIENTLRKQNKTYSQDKNIQKQQNNVSQFIIGINEMTQKLIQQRASALKLKQKIQIAEQKLNQLNQQRLQIKVHKAIGIQCPEKHKSFNQLLFGGLVFFLMGYFYQRWIST